MEPGDPKRSIAVIDYLRGFAALGVALLHVRVCLWIGWQAILHNPENFSRFDRLAAWLALPTTFAGSLVMLFFVVSGFCVHLPQSRSRVAFEFGPYFRRRFLRIYPAYLAAVLISAGFASVSNWRNALAAGLPSLLMLQNYRGGIAGKATFMQLASNPSLWSLPVEMELYLVYPFFLGFLRRWGGGRALGIAGVVSLAAAVAYGLGLRVLDGNFALYWVIWCSGAWLAERWTLGELRAPPAALNFAAAAALGFSIYRDAQKQDITLTRLSYAFFYFWLVWVLLANPASWNALPKRLAGAFQWLGTASYSFYLVHFPLFFLLGLAWTRAFGARSGNFLISLLACAAVLPAVALFYRLVERPSHLWARRSRDPLGR